MDLQHTTQFTVTVRPDPKHKSKALIEVADHGDGFWSWKTP